MNSYTRAQLLMGVFLLFSMFSIARGIVISQEDYSDFCVKNIGSNASYDSYDHKDSLIPCMIVQSNRTNTITFYFTQAEYNAQYKHAGFFDLSKWGDYRR